jgi:predicted transcriptional regulator
LGGAGYGARYNEISSETPIKHEPLKFQLHEFHAAPVCDNEVLIGMLVTPDLSRDIYRSNIMRRNEKPNLK